MSTDLRGDLLDVVEILLNTEKAAAASLRAGVRDGTDPALMTAMGAVCTFTAKLLNDIAILDSKNDRAGMDALLAQSRQAADDMLRLARQHERDVHMVVTPPPPTGKQVQ